MNPSRHIAIAAVVARLFFVSHMANAAPGDEHWDFRFGRVGVDGATLTLTWHAGQLYAGGWFKTAGHTLARSVARCDGTNFWPLAEGLYSTNGDVFPVFSLASFRGRLYAGGQFNASGMTELPGFACWNGTNWSAVSGPTGLVYTLTVFDDALYVGGRFGFKDDTNTYGVARWNGTDWKTFDSRIVPCVQCGDLGVGSVAVLGNQVFIAGNFEHVGDAMTTNRARWNGTAWEQFPANITGDIYQFNVHQSNLLASGLFNSIDATLATNIARWDGTNWWPLGAGLNESSDRMYSDGTELYAVGYFTASGDTPLDHVAKWNGSEWLPLGTNSFRSGDACYSIIKSPDGRLFASGSFNSVSGEPAGNIAEWNGSKWSPVTPPSVRGLSGSVGLTYGLTSSGDTIYIAGLFEAVGPVSANRIARLGPDEARALGPGITNTISRPRAVAVIETNVFIGGSPLRLEIPNGDFIGQWNGSTWGAVSGGVNSNIYALAAEGSRLYVGGQFTQAGSIPANRIACWDGMEWSALGDGLDWTVFALASSGSNLYAGGAFTNAGGNPAACIARWNGTSWSALGSGVGRSNTADVLAITASGTNVYVGGRFSTAGEIAANNVAMWNGTTWHSIGEGEENGVGGVVNALAVVNGNLFVGGGFTNAGSKVIVSLARWNGTNWSALGSGFQSFSRFDLIPPRVLALHARGGELFVGGFFSVAGNYPASGLARWVERPSLRLDALDHLGNNTRVRLGGLGGLRYTVQSSLNLSNWSDVISGRSEEEPVEFIDSKTDIRFYRAVLAE